jgi:hypothetical protein
MTPLAPPPEVQALIREALVEWHAAARESLAVLAQAYHEAGVPKERIPALLDPAIERWLGHLDRLVTQISEVLTTHDLELAMLEREHSASTLH